jgi:Ankyrin repeats (3 copies)
VVLKTLVDDVVCVRTIGLVCLGTPFRPVNVPNSIADALPVSARSSSMSHSTLTDEFDALPELLAEFRNAPRTKDVPIRCFYETDPVHGRIIVPKQAAVLDDPNAMSFALDDVDHYTINKFQSPLDHNYELVCDVLLGVVDNAYAAILTQAILNHDSTLTKAIITANRHSFATNDRVAEALGAAVTLGQESIVRLLLDANVRVNAHLNGAKNTALIEAVRSTNRDKIKIVRQLLEKGADVTPLNAENKSALDYATENGDEDVVKLLENRPLIVGPPVRKLTVPGDRIMAPRMLINDYDCTKSYLATVADVFVIAGNEKTFRRSPSVHDLIYEHGPRHLMNRATSRETEHGVRKYRWLHLPANNLTWVKDLIRRTYRERISDEHFSEAYYLQKFISITEQSHWEEFVVTSPIEELSHIRYLLPRCRTLPYIGYPPDLPTADVIIFMPFLHYEQTAQRRSMAATIEKVREGVRSAPPRPENNTSEQNSIWAYLRGDIPLHVRRTLDQFYYDSLDSDAQQKRGVPARNEDQVTQRFMRDQEQWKNEDPLLLMVDQLWIVLLEDGMQLYAYSSLLQY